MTDRLISITRKKDAYDVRYRFGWVSTGPWKRLPIRCYQLKGALTVSIAAIKKAGVNPGPEHFHPRYREFLLELLQESEKVKCISFPSPTRH